LQPCLLKIYSNMVVLWGNYEGIPQYKTSKGQDPEKQANFAYGVALLSIGQTSSLVENYSHDGDGNVLSYTDKGIDKEYTFGKSRIPIADDCSSCLICVDLSPTEEGSFGQVILIDYDYKVALKLADSLAELISNFKKDLEPIPKGIIV
ncbi:SMI1/KNR4 family protein, partial [Vibrio parahaemolyticus]|nr:SMI1/KNR4 family protein [Vibrio parahaemolyticus]